MYLAAEGVRLGSKGSEYSADEGKSIKAYGGQLTAATRFIPGWVKVSVALALGLGTMIGWKRIVVTVGEKIGKDHLTYAQGASAELVAMVTIGMAARWGLPVSTTHILSSGVAGTMVANGSGLQASTIRNIVPRLGADASLPPSSWPARCSGCSATSSEIARLIRL